MADIGIYGGGYYEDESGENSVNSYALEVDGESMEGEEGDVEESELGSDAEEEGSEQEDANSEYAEAEPEEGGADDALWGAAPATRGAPAVGQASSRAAGPKVKEPKAAAPKAAAAQKTKGAASTITASQRGGSPVLYGTAYRGGSPPLFGAAATGPAFGVKPPGAPASQGAPAFGIRAPQTAQFPQAAPGPYVSARAGAPQKTWPGQAAGSAVAHVASPAAPQAYEPEKQGAPLLPAAAAPATTVVTRKVHKPDAYTGELQESVGAPSLRGPSRVRTYTHEGPGKYHLPKASPPGITIRGTTARAARSIKAGGGEYLPLLNPPDSSPESAEALVEAIKKFYEAKGCL